MLAYVIRKDKVVPEEAPTLSVNQIYLTKNGSVESDLAASASYDHSFFKMITSSYIFTQKKKIELLVMNPLLNSINNITSCCKQGNIGPFQKS